MQNQFWEIEGSGPNLTKKGCHTTLCWVSVKQFTKYWVMEALSES